MRKFAFFALAAGLALGCSEDNGTQPTGVTIADLVGTWNVTKWEYQDAANTALKENIVVFGFGASVTIASDGTYQGTLSVPDPASGNIATVPFNGTVSITNDQLTLSFANLLDLGVLVLDPADPQNFTLTLDPSGSALTLFGTGYQWDFIADDPTGDVTANLTINFART
jgi:hypothetical protein